MTAPDPPPLWLQAIPDRELWRRGRDMICGLSLLILLGQLALILLSILLGDVRTFFIAVGLGVVAFLLLFFIWIGHNWPRWVLAPLFACSGFANVIWSMTQKSGPLFLLGLSGLTIFTYLALAPSVYAFARRQRERVSLTESLVVGGVLLLMLTSVGCGLYGFYIYETDLQEEATRFPRRLLTRSSCITTWIFCGLI